MNNNSPITSVATSKQALWFLMVGASAALVHFLVLVSIVSFTTITPIWANVFAFLIAFVVSFLGHFYLTFRQSESSFGNEEYINSQNATHPSWPRSLSALANSALVKWFASSAAGFIANQSLFILGLNWFGERYYMFIWLIVTGIITVMTFSLGKLWAFKS